MFDRSAITLREGEGWCKYGRVPVGFVVMRYCTGGAFGDIIQ
jgi:hypothetical protein